MKLSLENTVVTNNRQGISKVLGYAPADHPPVLRVLRVIALIHDPDYIVKSLVRINIFNTQHPFDVVLGKVHQEAKPDFLPLARLVVAVELVPVAPARIGVVLAICLGQFLENLPPRLAQRVGEGEPTLRQSSRPSILSGSMKEQRRRQLSNRNGFR